LVEKSQAAVGEVRGMFFSSIMASTQMNELHGEVLDIGNFVNPAYSVLLIRAREIRCFPILLTTMTALGGLLPLAIQKAALYSPPSWVIIGGLITSTLLTRVVTPVMYRYLLP
jgi:hypothetical protein